MSDVVRRRKSRLFWKDYGGMVFATLWALFILFAIAMGG